MSAFRDCLFNIWRSSFQPPPEDAPCCADKDLMKEQTLLKYNQSFPPLHGWRWLVDGFPCACSTGWWRYSYPRASPERHITLAGVKPCILNLGPRWRHMISVTHQQIYPTKWDPITHWIGGWMESRAGLDILERKKRNCHCQKSSHIT